LHRVEGGDGEWDDIRDFRAADFVTDSEGTGFVHCAPSHGMEEFELYRDLGMLEQVITYNVMEDGRFRADMPFFGGKAILKPMVKRAMPMARSLRSWLKWAACLRAVKSSIAILIAGAPRLL
jgi:hypothetical protein